MQGKEIEFFSLADAARFSHVGRQAVFVAIKKGQLKATKKMGTSGKMQWFIKRSDLDEYRANKYCRDKRVVDGEKLFDIENDRWSVLHASKTLSAMLGKPFPTAHIYYLLRTGKIRGMRKGGSWVISRDSLVDLYYKESGENPNQLELA